MRERERGSVALWMLGLSLLILTLGGISLDLWRISTERRELAVVADSVALAAASGIDEGSWRLGGDLRIDRVAAEELALTAILAQPAARDISLTDRWIVFDPSGTTVTVQLHRPVHLTLLRLAHPGPLIVTASATAAAELRA